MLRNHGGTLNKSGFIILIDHLFLKVAEFSVRVRVESIYVRSFQEIQPWVELPTWRLKPCHDSVETDFDMVAVDDHLAAMFFRILDKVFGRPTSEQFLRDRAARIYSCSLELIRGAVIQFERVGWFSAFDIFTNSAFCVSNERFAVTKTNNHTCSNALV